MADKESTLSIVVRTVDRATSGLRAINERIKGLGTGLHVITAPVRLVGEKLAALGKEAGIPKLVDGIKGVGGAAKDMFGRLKDVGGRIADLFGGLLGISVGLGAAVYGVKSLVDEFDDLGDKAERLGVSANFLAQIRYAAEKSGASIEQLDGGLQAFSESLGQARAGTGRMASFLGKVSPALLNQLKATKSNEQAFLLLADAMAKVTDPAKRAALAQRTVGDSALAPLLARGAKGINDLRDSYYQLAGSQQDAADGAGQVDDSMHDLKAATDGIKAAIVTGLSPALKIVVDQLTQWFSGHREDIKQWATEIGKRLPGAVASIASAIRDAIGTAVGLVDAIGGIKVAALGLAAVFVGPLVSSLVTLSAALLSTPAGWIITAIGLIAFGAIELVRHWDAVGAFFGDLWTDVKDAFARFGAWLYDNFVKDSPVGVIIDNWSTISAFFGDLWDGITSRFSAAWDAIKGIVDKIVGAVDAVKGSAGSLIDFLNPFSVSAQTDAVSRSIGADRINAAAGAGSRTEARVTVDFANAPRGTRVASDPSSTADVDLSVGYQMVGLGA